MKASGPIVDFRPIQCVSLCKGVFSPQRRCFAEAHRVVNRPKKCLEGYGAPVSARVETLLSQLTLEEKVSLLAGRNFWHTVAVDRLEIPRMRVSDGPAGVRGSLLDGPASLNIPCSTALGATWDPALIREVGELLGREARAKGARVHLAPTVNLHRTPVGGRNFECMSEDPLLTALLAVEYVNGVQSAGVASCIKHFVGNDTEFERYTIDSRIDERTLREMYLVPFERAVSDAGVMSVMTSYNRVNGPYAADSEWLLAGVLRGEWGFDGAVISDWYGLHSTADGINAGTDLEMPGPTLHRGEKLLAAVRAGEVTEQVIDARVTAVLMLMERTGALDEVPGEETTRDDDDDLALVRRAGAAGMVLVKNETVHTGPVLPIDPAMVRRIALVGPNAERATIMGGGSAKVTPTRVSDPLEALRRRFAADGVEVVHARGCSIDRTVPELPRHLASDVIAEFFAAPDDLDDPAAVPLVTDTLENFRVNWFVDPVRRRATLPFGARVTFSFSPDVDGEWTFGLECVGAGRLIIDGATVIDTTGAPVGGSFFGNGNVEQRGTATLTAGASCTVCVEVRYVPGITGGSGMNLGARPPEDPEQMLTEAVEAAASSDIAIVVVGTTAEWESEGWDRDDIALPGRQNELVARVASAAPATAVVINAGSPVSMPWLDDVEAVIVAWFAGQEMGDALADVLVGDIEPGGRLPVTFPHTLEDTPAFEHHPGRNGAAHYLEGRLVGYRWYDTVGREPLFPFGFGLGYADISVEDAVALDPFRLSVGLQNRSDRDGTQTVQVYAHRLDRRGLPGDEPEQRLVGFARVRVAAGGRTEAVVNLDRDAYRTWDADAGAWVSWTGGVELRVGTSSRHFGARVGLASIVAP